MENALATLDLPTVKASGHVFESKCCFTGKEENTLIINIIDKNGSETILYKIVADATYVK